MLNMEMEIQKNIPVPKKDGWKKRLDRLEIGEHLPFEPEEVGTVSHAVSFYMHRLTKKRFTVSSIHNKVWRIEDDAE